jgi:hypothetical protein
MIFIYRMGICGGKVSVFVEDGMHSDRRAGGGSIRSKNFDMFSIWEANWLCDKSLKIAVSDIVSMF